MNHVISKSGYIETILQRSYMKMTIYGQLYKGKI